jgi:ABC-type dipeptide/oligopeptide/nickel transport system ATPase subunit
MITELSFDNFKSWKKIDKMQFAPITGLFGPNSSGKTSILQLLLMIKQTVESTDRLQVLNLGNEKSPANLGSIQDVVHAHDMQGNLGWSIQWNLPKLRTIQDPTDEKKCLFMDAKMGLSVEITANAKKRLAVEKVVYTFSGQAFTMRRKQGGKGDYKLDVTPSENFKLKRPQGRSWGFSAPVKCYGFPNEINARYTNVGFLSDLQLEFEQLFSTIKYLGPLRDYPKRLYPWSGAEPADMGPRGERFVEALLAAREGEMTLARGQGRKRETLEQRVAFWLKELKLVHTFKVEPIAKEGGNIYRVGVQRHLNAPSVLITDVGFGVSQILPAIVLCYYAPEGSIIILEQPEIHLHPSVQAGLADIFMDAVKTRKIQIIFESHSEHLLKRLQLRIAEQAMNPNDAALYFCESDNGSSKLTKLDVDLFGGIRNWPKDFFGDQFGEMAATTKAAMKRMRTAPV